MVPEGKRLAGTKAVSCEPETNVVARFAAPNRTTLAAWKPDPFTVSVKAGPPATVEAGESEAIDATG